MEPNTKTELTGKEEIKFPFAFQGLGFFLMNENTSGGDFDKEIKNPRDISHISKRSYKYLAHPFETEYCSSEESNTDSLQQSNL
jgi:hypothetical protein